ncbi:hypothetical protein M409DRAFT_19784 [Zasmidium cellare ATCC 36951]|uniref:2EXR domain-containing protein n=1 Tax=Zasmidium cellare ATCC 36951 TaxID=1080233 RepID=A0A6A6CSW0_ZASCE|nr:uncharacterized protein M409DRAFT_19784 [Zasmidium cellare ATCC 36951]KAF2170181.1 hypothetical protein M409DRAFT_19784 [Zasmidium cellare ATCC 36951]
MPPKRKPGQQGQLAAPTKRRKMKKRIGDDNGKKRTSFLDLPPELRNDIYERALIQPTTITVTHSLKDPKLLRTCRQIRFEARKIFYLRNSFRVVVHNCDARLLAAFERHIAQFEQWEGGKIKVETLLYIAISGRKVWGNLVQWCFEVHQRGGGFLGPKPSDNRLRSVIAAAHAVTNASGGVSWEKCLEALEAMRAALGLVDKGWLRDD